MVKTRKIAKENDRLLSLCRPVNVHLTRTVFTSHKRSKNAENSMKSNQSETESKAVISAVKILSHPSSQTRNFIGELNGE